MKEINKACICIKDYRYFIGGTRYYFRKHSTYLYVFFAESYWIKNDELKMIVGVDDFYMYFKPLDEHREEVMSKIFD